MQGAVAHIHGDCVVEQHNVLTDKRELFAQVAQRN